MIVYPGLTEPAQSTGISVLNVAALRFIGQPGTRLPLLHSAMGRALLAFEGARCPRRPSPVLAGVRSARRCRRTGSSRLGDGRRLTGTGVVHPFDGATAPTADVTGVRTLTLRVTDGGDGKNYDHADWADARLICS